MNSAITPRLELVTCVLFAAALLLTLQLHLLPSLLAGLLVYALVHMLVPLLRLPGFGPAGARPVAVTLIATPVIALIAPAAVVPRPRGGGAHGLVREPGGLDPDGAAGRVARAHVAPGEGHQPQAGQFQVGVQHLLLQRLPVHA